MELITSVKYAPATWNTIYRGNGNLNLRSLPLYYIGAQEGVFGCVINYKSFVGCVGTFY